MSEPPQLVYSDNGYLLVPKSTKLFQMIIDGTLPQELQSETLYENFVSHDSYNWDLLPPRISYVPVEYRTEKVCCASKFLSKKYQAQYPEVCLAHVKSYGLNLLYVDRKVRTQEICDEAVKQNYKAFRYVQWRFVHQQMIESVLKQDGTFLGCIPPPKRTEELCRFALVQPYSAHALRHVPSHIQQNVGFGTFAIECLKQHHRLGICDASLLRFIPEPCWDVDYAKHFVTQTDGFALEYIPESVRTPELCMFAITKHSSNIRYVPESLLSSSDNYYWAVLKAMKSFRYVPVERRSPEMIQYLTDYQNKQAAIPRKIIQPRSPPPPPQVSCLCELFSNKKFSIVIEHAVDANASKPEPSPTPRIKWSDVSSDLKAKYEPHIFKDVYGEDELPKLSHYDHVFLSTIDFDQ